jgi:molecular chaperone DnaK (HSP70)
VEQVIADYLRFLWNHVTAAIEKSEMQAVVRVTPYVVVLTFPAIWKPDAVEKMKSAAKRAGILEPRGRAGKTVLHTVEEPEAAALATYADLSEDHPAFTVSKQTLLTI